MEQEKKVLLIKLSALEDRMSNKIPFDDDNFLRRFKMKKFFLVFTLLFSFSTLLAEPRMPLPDARTYCTARNMRLPTEKEMVLSAASLKRSSEKCVPGIFWLYEGLSIFVSSECNWTAAIADNPRNNHQVICVPR